MLPRLLVLVAAFVGSLPASAEMQKIATVCNQKGICLHWWPVLPEIEGWSHDRGASLQLGVNAQVPVGGTFVDAEAIIYAKGSYKPRIPNTKSVADFIENDKKDFLSSTPDLEIAEVKPLITKDGQSLRSFMFTPGSKGQWERVSYGEEDDFFLSFVVSAKSKDGLDRVMKDYIRFIERYQKTPNPAVQPDAAPAALGR